MKVLTYFVTVFFDLLLRRFQACAVMNLCRLKLVQNFLQLSLNFEWGKIQILHSSNEFMTAK